MTLTLTSQTEHGLLFRPAVVGVCDCCLYLGKRCLARRDSEDMLRKLRARGIGGAFAFGPRNLSELHSLLIISYRVNNLRSDSN
ncbi:hypothetical protein MHYP_G00137980 [Metynnis hypsauchen]